MIKTTLHCFNVKCGFYNTKLISQKSNREMILARFLLQGIMFIRIISSYATRASKKTMKPNRLYSTFCDEISITKLIGTVVMANFTTKSGI